uniref:Cell adhesion molecule CEACAM5 n=1 Tax=Pogona vitticeps TaxID=103695 RepID=A0ABM5ESA8_9SAUR
MGGPGWQIPWQATLLAASILSSCFLLSQGQSGTIPVTVDPPMPREGETVTLKPGSVPENSVSCRWHRGAAADENLIIALFFFPGPGGDTKGPAYTGRETVDSSCSLQITDLKSNYTGTYRVSIDGIGISETGSANVTVIGYNLLSQKGLLIVAVAASFFFGLFHACRIFTRTLPDNNVLSFPPVEELFTPFVSVSPSPFPRELIDHVELTCNTVNSELAIVSWLWDGEPLGSSSHIQLSENNRVLTIQPVFRNDTGEYQCEVSYLSSNETSDKIFIPVIFGPDEPVIEPKTNIYYEHSDIRLSCKANAFPDPTYMWFLNGRSHSSGSDLLIRDVTWQESGNYTCQATHVLTHKMANASLEIEVLGNVYNVTITGPFYAEENQEVTLTCHSEGTDVSYYWLKGNQSIQATESVFLESNTLTLNPTTRDDAANYTCYGNNSFSSNSSEPHWLEVFYGPDEPSIQPNRSVYQEFETLKLSCSASSNPPANYSWYHNGQPLEHGNTSQLVIPSLSPSDNGSYTCNATNRYTGLFSATDLEITILSSVNTITITGPSYVVENQEVTLTCHSEGTDVSYYWLKGNQSIQAAEGVFLESNTLTLNPTTRDDAANYTCYGNNSFSSNISEPHWLEIFYGPDEPSIQPNRSVYQAFETLSLSCSANSNPPANYSWYHNGQPLEHRNTSQLVIPSLSPSDNGSYTCNATNSYTGLFSATDLEITILSEWLRCPRSQNSSAAGASFPSDAVLLSFGLSVLMGWFFRGTGSSWCFPQIKLNYLVLHCPALGGSSGTPQEETWSSFYDFSVPTGSVNTITITGPSYVVENQEVTLTCHSEGTDVSYYWLKGNQSIQAAEGVFLENNKLTLNPTTRDDAANYTCYGNNSVSSNSSEPHWLEVFYGPDEPLIEPNRSVYQEFETLKLSCSASSNPPANYSWYHNGQPLEHGNTSQLEIPSLSLSDGGNYTCNATNNYTGLFNDTSLEISILGEWMGCRKSVTNVTIISDPIKVFENNKTVLTCTSAGTSVSYFWLKGSQSLEADGHISMTNNSQVLTFNPVSRNDSDNYTCYGNNTFSSNHATYELNVFYGPDELIISPDNLYHEKGSNLNLTCKADSNPPANYTWSIQESVQQIGSTLSLINLSFNDTGNYTCEAFNNETGLNSFKVVEIKVLEKLSQPILSPANYVALENENIILYCNISSSTAFSISWFRNGEPVSPEADISENKKNLTLRNFTSADAGIYTCVASNQISSETSNPSSITLAYGPVDIKVEPAGVITLKLASKLDLLCSADSNPAAEFQWFINGTVQSVTNNRFSVDSVAWKDGGNYTCQANNTVTKNHVSTSVIVKVANQDAPGGGGGGLSGGAIAGIVIGCLAAVILIVGVLYYVCTKTSLGRTEHHISNGNVPSAPGHNQGVTDTKPRSGEEDIQYTTLAFNAKNPPQPASGDAQPSDGTIIYSEIKKK